jgi:hypothetical protein
MGLFIGSEWSWRFLAVGAVLFVAGFLLQLIATF